MQRGREADATLVARPYPGFPHELSIDPSHRSFGFHGAAPLIALVYLCCGGVMVGPPLR